MASDFTIKAGDTLPVLTDTLTYSNGSSANLTGASVNFVMRASTSTSPLIDTPATITNPSTGAVSFTFSATQSATPGNYMGEWKVTFSGGTTQTWPTDGYIAIWIEESLRTSAQVLCSVADAKDFLSIPPSNRSLDQKLARFIRAARPVVEQVTGPIIETQYDEWYEGGQPWIVTRHRPVMKLLAVSEYRGPVEYPLSLIQSPDFGQVNSAMLDVDGRIVRRGPGGSAMPFFNNIDSVHVVYTAGRSSIPENVREAVLELVRENFVQTQQGGRPNLNAAQSAPDLPGRPADVFLSDRVRQMLVPNRRHPSLY